MNEKLTLEDLKSRWVHGRQDAPHGNSKIRCSICGNYAHFSEWRKTTFSEAKTIQLRRYECPVCKSLNKFKRGMIWT